MNQPRPNSRIQPMAFIARAPLPSRPRFATQTVERRGRPPSRTTPALKRSRVLPLIALSVRPAAVAAAAALALSLAPGGLNPVAPPVSASVPAAARTVAARGSALAALSLSAPAPLAVSPASDAERAEYADRSVLLAAPSLQDMGSAASAAREQQLVDDGEFALSVRLVTAVVVGALVGMEPGAPVLGLGVRAVTLTSLSAALATVCASVPAGYSSAAFAQAIPSALAPVAAAAGAVAVLGLLACISPNRPPSRSRALRTAAVVALTAALGAAAAAGQPLGAASAYLAALTVLRSVPIRKRSRRRRPRVVLRVNSPQGSRVAQGGSLREAVRNLNLAEESAA